MSFSITMLKDIRRFVKLYNNEPSNVMTEKRYDTGYKQQRIWLSIYWTRQDWEVSKKSTNKMELYEAFFSTRPNKTCELIARRLNILWSRTENMWSFTTILKQLDNCCMCMKPPLERSITIPFLPYSKYLLNICYLSNLMP